MSEDAAESSPSPMGTPVTAKDPKAADPLNASVGFWKRAPVWKKGLVALLLASPVLVLFLWWAVHTFPWAGPLVANGLRKTIGKDNVTRLEEFVYSIEDRVNRSLKKHDAPKAYWSVPAASQTGTAGPKASSAGPSTVPTNKEEEGPEPEEVVSPFAPANVGPVHKSWSAEGDGVWIPLLDPRRPEEAPRMMKTLLHPDHSRSWAELFVVAVDLRTVRVMPVMGYQEPRTDKKEAENYVRPAKIPEKHYGALLAAFNGGFMAEHGSYGVYFDGITFIDPKDDACTLAQYLDGTFTVATWSRIKERASEMEWFRQAPNCMYEDNKMHPALKAYHARKWGATLDGETVIRRSAVGISADGQILYIGISNHTNAKVMALGMNHAGAVAVAQMDVNWSYPKFVTYKKGEGDLLYPVALAEGFEFNDKLYLRERSMRDFFYLARKEELPPSDKAPASQKTAVPDKN